MAVGTIHNRQHRRTRVYHKRVERNWSLIQLSVRTGLPTGTLSKYEVGMALPRVDYAIVLAKASGTSVEELFQGAN